MIDPTSPTTNLGAIHDDTVRSHPDRIALIDGGAGERITYSELGSAVARSANALDALGVERGDRVALFFPNELQSLYVFFGSMRIGAVPVPVNVELGDDALRHVVADSGATVAVTSTDETVWRCAVDVVGTDGTDVETLAVVGDDVPGDVDDVDDAPDDVGDTSVVSFDALRRRAADECPPCDVAFDDPALQPYTSGSTGAPKGVVLTHGGAYWNNRVFQQVCLVDETERILTATPLYHKNAMINIKSALLGGGSAVVMPGFDAAAVIEAIETYRVTYLTGVPAIYRLLLRSDALDAHDVSSVRAGGCGSDAVPESLYDDFEAAFGAPLLEGYGLTEGGPMVTTSPRWGVRRRGSAGLALPGVDTRVVDPDTREPLPPDRVGELVVASPGVAEFHERPDLDSRFEERDGKRFLRTGDLVRKDEDGFHFIVGRTDDMFVVGGENLYPVDVEDLLGTHESVDDVAVVAVPHEVKGNAPVAFVVASDAVTEAELQDFAAEHGPRYAVPRRVLFRQSLPLTSTEKVDRDTLEREAREAVGGTLGEE